MHRVPAVLVSALGVVPLLAAPAQAGQGAPPFVFTSDRDGDNEIYRVRADGRVVQLTRNDVHDGDAVWSPDGPELAFVSSRDGDLEVFVMDADGSGVRQLTHNEATADSPAGDFSPDWAPDGDALVFVSDRDEPEGDIYTMAADGTDVARLTATPFITDYSPTWSPERAAHRVRLHPGRHRQPRGLPPGHRRLGPAPADPDGGRRVGRQPGVLPRRSGDRVQQQPRRSRPRSVHDAGRRQAGAGADRRGRLRRVVPDVDPDGRQVMYWSLSLDGKVPDVAWLVDRDGTDARPLTSGESNDSFPDVRPPAGC